MTQHEVVEIDIGLPLDARGRRRVRTVNDQPSMTVQSDAHMTDIQTILKSFGAGGMEALDQAQLIYRDVSDFTDLADALNQAKAAEVDFMKLPSKVREIFDHDVAVWLDTAHDVEKRDALVSAGFLDPPPEVVVEERVPAQEQEVPAAQAAGEAAGAAKGSGETSGSGEPAQ